MAQRFGEWGVMNTDHENALIAGTMNASEQILAQGCFLGEGSCYWMLGLDISCVKGEKGAVLVNASNGSQTLQVYCLDGVSTGNGRYRYAFSKFDAMDELVRESRGIIGFAFPLKNGEFQVVRFDLDGAVASVDSMRRTASQRVGKTPTIRGTRDQRL